MYIILQHVHRIICHSSHWKCKIFKGKSYIVNPPFLRHTHVQIHIQYTYMYISFSDATCSLLSRQKDGEDAVVIQNMDTLAVISKLLRVREETLRLALTTRKSRAGGADLFITPYKMDEVD